MLSKRIRDDFDAAIQEDASLNYAKLSYEIGNSYQSVPAVLQGFLKPILTNASKAVEKLLMTLTYLPKIIKKRYYY
jgi:hypothetical protein